MYHHIGEINFYMFIKVIIFIIMIILNLIKLLRFYVNLFKQLILNKKYHMILSKILMIYLSQAMI